MDDYTSETSNLLSYDEQNVNDTPQLISGIRFIPFDSLVNHGRFPRCPDDDYLTIDLSTIDRNNSLLIFISHNWLRGDDNAEGWDGVPNPDVASGDKYSLCVEGIRRLKKFYASHTTKCFVWMDYSCMNQDSKELSPELEHYDRIVQSCDCLLTPIVNCEDSTEAKTNRDLDTYMSKAWCRMEMLYGANLPVESSTLITRHTLFENPTYSSQRKRPHFLFSTDLLPAHGPPLIMPPLQSTYLEVYHPLKGEITRESDFVVIAQLMSEVQPYIEANKNSVGYQGEFNEDGEKDGFGVMTFENGDVYEGEWKRGEKHGEGTFRSINGDVYEGKWDNGRREGLGVSKFVNGSLFEGEWKLDKQHGKGIAVYGDGNKYEGEWENGFQHGHGKFCYSDGSVYEGLWKDGKQHGKGIFRQADEGSYSEEWNEGCRVSSALMSAKKRKNSKKREESIHQSTAGYEGLWKEVCRRVMALFDRLTQLEIKSERQRSSDGYRFAGKDFGQPMDEDPPSEY